MAQQQGLLDAETPNVGKSSFYPSCLGPEMGLDLEAGLTLQVWEVMGEDKKEAEWEPGHPSYPPP